METDNLLITSSNIRLAPKIRTQEEITANSLKQAMTTWGQYRLRYISLYKYFIGKHPIDDVNDLENPDKNHIIANHCHYIVNAFKGYMVGNPPAYVCADDDKNAKEIIDLFKKQSKAKVEAQIAQDLSIFGVAYELVYLDEKGVPKSTVVSPLDCFVAYSGDIEADSVFGAVRYEEKDDKGLITYKLYVYTRTERQIWKSPSADGPWEIVEGTRPHGFLKVPIIEYENNSERMGDFEQIITLQDAYNSLISDRMDDKDAFAKSIMTITGHVIGKTPEEVEESVKVLKKHRVLQFDEEGASAAYLEKTMDETGVQILQDQIKSDIHKFAMVPDLSDEQFANNASGIAMAYKLFGTDQRVAEKIPLWQAGFTRRCKLYDTAMHNPTLSPVAKTDTDIPSMQIVFRLNSPQDLSYMAQSLTTLVGSEIISKQTARANLMIVEDPDEEAERIKTEREEDDERNRATFDSDFHNQPRPNENGQPMNDGTDNSSQ